MNLSGLSSPFPNSAVHWRVQGKPYERNGNYSAMALAYLDARDVMDRLDEVCGPENWQSLFDETPRGRVICRLGIRIGDDWVYKSDGAGDTDVEGEKGGISDALKRAAVSWGIGRYLYRLDSPWVACEVTDKGAWKRWKEDPWSKIKGAKPVVSENPAQRASNTEIDAAIEQINGLANLSALQTWWGALYTNARHVAESPAVIAAKDKRKAELSERKAA